jgi:uncharacterized protein YxjI
MKHWFATWILFLILNPVFAFDLEQRMYLSEHYVSYTTSFDVSTDDRKLGTMYRRILSLTTVYDFYDIRNKLIATAQSHFFTYGAHLDIYDENKILLGTVEEKVYNFFPSFNLYAPDGARLANATMNFWGTTFTLYDGLSTYILAEMSRDIFRVRNHWTLNIKDLARVKEKKIDSRLLLTVLAIQGDIEYLERNRQRERRDDRNNNPLPSRGLTAVQHSQNANIHPNYLNLINKEQNLSGIALPNTQQMEQLSQQLDTGFQQQYAGVNMSDTEKTEQFVHYCTNIAESSDTTRETQKAIWHLLNTRFTAKTK